MDTMTTTTDLTESFIKEAIGDMIIAMEKGDDDNYFVTTKVILECPYDRMMIISDDLLKIEIEELNVGILFNDMGRIHQIIKDNKFVAFHATPNGISTIRDNMEEQCEIWGIENVDPHLAKFSTIKDFRKNFKNFVNALQSIVENGEY